MQCTKVVKKLEELSPISFAENWDNVGLLAGRWDKEITSVMIALDATDEVIELAVRQKVSMLITHHPLIFSAMKRVNTGDFIGKRLVKLLQEDICYYAMHTNFDIMGMAEAASAKLDLVNTQVLSVTFEKEGIIEGIGRMGQISKTINLEQCATLVKERFCLQQVKVFGVRNKSVNRIAICPGSGKTVINRALELQADVLITGDIDHHTGIDALAQGLCIVDAGHYGLEKIFAPYLKDYLEKNIRNIKIHLSQETDPFYYI